jgi:hypothetical protein
MSIPQYVEEALASRERARVNWTKLRRSINERLARVGPDSVTAEERIQLECLLKIFRNAMIERNRALDRYFPQKAVSHPAAG